MRITKDIFYKNSNISKFSSYLFLILYIFTLSSPIVEAQKTKKQSTKSIVVNTDTVFSVKISNSSVIYCTTTKGKTLPGKIKSSDNNQTKFTLYVSIINEQIKKFKKFKPKDYQKKIKSLKQKLSTYIKACRNNSSTNPNNGNPENPTEILSETQDNLSKEDAQHLYRRAGFGGTDQEINLAIQTGLRATVERLLNPTETPELDQEVIGLFDGDPEPQSPPDEISEYGLRLVFLTYMLKSPNQLKEKMAFFWHDHLAASARVVSGNSHHLVQDYLNIIRENSLGNIRTMLQKITTNGMMLRWLDGDKNKVGSVNENYAREFWELFSLGRDFYTEKDIAEAAKAFTGWTLKWDDTTRRYEVAFVPALLDKSTKTIFENSPFTQVGDFKGEDIINITLDKHPQSAKHFVSSIYKFLVKTQPSIATTEVMAKLLKDNNFSITPLLRKILLSKEFFSTANRFNSVKTPLEFTLGLLRATQLPLYDIRYLERNIRDSGLTLLNPPSVKGWDDNEYWINDQWMINRANFVHDILNEASPMDSEFSLKYLLTAENSSSEQFLTVVTSRFGVKLSTVKSSNNDRYLNYIRKWNDTLEPWLFDPRHQENFESKARGLLFILAQDENYQMN